MLNIRIAVSGSFSRMRRLDAIDLRQRTIHHDDAGAELFGKFDGLEPVARFANNGERRFVFQHAPEAAPHQRMVVHQEHG
jgi:hypothetical protein